VSLVDIAPAPIGQKAQPAAADRSRKTAPAVAANRGARAQVRALIPRGLTAKIRNGALRPLHSVFIFGVCDERRG
jgi:hypothetical protein